MARSRTIKTLTALVIAMTLGALLLVALDRAPDWSTPHLSAQTSSGATDRAINRTDIPIESGKWAHIVIHSAREGSEVAAKCHFIVDGATFAATDTWRKQRTANHVYGFARGHDYNADSIGIFVRGDTPYSQPSAEEAATLGALIHNLQKVCRIDSGKVFFYSDLNINVPQPSQDLVARIESQLKKYRPN